MTKLSFNERYNLGVELLTYLNSIGVTFNKITFSELEKLYANSFKDELIRTRQDVAALPDLRGILHPLSIKRIVFFINKEVIQMTRSGTRIFSSNQSYGVKSTPSAQRSVENHFENNSKKRRRRTRRSNPPTKLAVDQHLVIKKEPEENAGSAAENVDLGLPRFIHKRKEKYKCIACGLSCPNYNEIMKHLRCKQHQVALAMDGLKNKPELVENKDGVIIISEHDGKSGFINLDINEAEVKRFDIQIKNMNSHAVKLLRCEKLTGTRVFQLDDVEKITEGTDRPVIIKPGQTYVIKVTVVSRNIGCFNTPVAFLFQLNNDENSKFHILRHLQANCMNDSIKDMRPQNKFKHPPRKALKKKAEETIEGFKLPSPSGDSLERNVDLKPFIVSNCLRHIINRGLSDTNGLKASEKIELTSVRSILEGELNINTYCQRLENLLYSEEIQMEVDIRQYDMEQAVLNPSPEDRRLLVLEVPGLSENRPSILRGDWLFVSEMHDYRKEYKGYVHAVHLNTVSLGFDKCLVDSVTPAMKFYVRFVFSRLPIRLQHRACQLVDNDRRSYKQLLFPDTYNNNAIQSTMQLNKTKVNPEQESAIRHIVAGTSKPAPYLVFGPPGTGKTFTIVEAMKQVLTHIPNAHILACAPSNTAADLVTEKLLDDEKILGSIMRMNALSQSWNFVAEKVKHVCNYDKRSKSYYYPSKKELMEYKVIVCTAVTAGRLVTAGFPKGHFTHIFFDEAGHSLETETLIPITNMLDLKTGQLVLAGDPKQLGPILRSPISIKYGLGTSLLERYMTEIDIYKRHKDQHGNMKYNPKVLTKLVRNYRSHPAILQQPNMLFYDNELQAYAEPRTANAMCGWEKLPNKDFPIIFHSVIGEEQREERSPSFFNPAEVHQVMEYITELKKQTGKFKVGNSDIGVITPYHKQVMKIRNKFLNKGWNNIRVGSVEEFQGQERKVIIVSTVRSSPQYLSLDFNHNIGFVRNPQRFNVTVTRAKSLLIVVGNPSILQRDEIWSSFINYVRKNCAIINNGHDLDGDELYEDIYQRLKVMNLHDENGVNKEHR